MTTFSAVAVEPGSIRLGGHQLPVREHVATATAQVTWHDTDYQVRAWTFAERRRLLAAHVDGAGNLDVAALADSAIELLVEPVPAQPNDRDVLALAALAWSAMAGARIAPPVPGVDPAAQTVALAAVTGWRPVDIDTSLAADVDHWYHAAATPARLHAVPDSTPGPGSPQQVSEGGESFRTFRLED